jgi:hypothetical protein
VSDGFVQSFSSVSLFSSWFSLSLAIRYKLAASSAFISIGALPVRIQCVCKPGYFDVQKPLYYTVYSSVAVPFHSPDPKWCTI